MSTKRLATDAMFLTLALVVSYIEVLIPVPVGIPGVKLGLANGVIMVLLFLEVQQVLMIQRFMSLKLTAWETAIHSIK